jgi:hypothetical protein
MYVCVCVYMCVCVQEAECMKFGVAAGMYVCMYVLNPPSICDTYVLNPPYVTIKPSLCYTYLLNPPSPSPSLSVLNIGTNAADVNTLYELISTVDPPLASGMYYILTPIYTPITTYYHL